MSKLPLDEINEITELSKPILKNNPQIELWKTICEIPRHERKEILIIAKLLLTKYSSPQDILQTLAAFESHKREKMVTCTLLLLKKDPKEPIREILIKIGEILDLGGEHLFFQKSSFYFEQFTDYENLCIQSFTLKMSEEEKASFIEMTTPILLNMEKEGWHFIEQLCEIPAEQRREVLQQGWSLIKDHSGLGAANILAALYKIPSEQREQVILDAQDLSQLLELKMIFYNDVKNYFPFMLKTLSHIEPSKINSCRNRT